MYRENLIESSAFPGDGSELGRESDAQLGHPLRTFRTMDEESQPDPPPPPPPGDPLNNG